MPKNMSTAEIRRGEAEMERLRPEPLTRSSAHDARSVASYDIALGTDALFLRLALADGDTVDVSLSQVVAVSLVGQIAKSLHLADWMDSGGIITADPERG